jgi:hypothetical protein
MTLRELIVKSCLNGRGFMRNTRYSMFHIHQQHWGKTYSQLPAEYQRTFRTIHNNLILLRDGRTFLTDYEGLRKCQIKVYSRRFANDTGIKCPQRKVQEVLSKREVIHVLGIFEEFLQG